LGRPLLYGTTRRFLEHFGFMSLDDLPRPEELPILLRERAPLEELMAEEQASLEPDGEGAEGKTAGEVEDSTESGEESDQETDGGTLDS